MIIYPAIDLKQGRCVRLLQGDFAQMTVYEQDPIVQAQDYARSGAEFVHVVDLDGAQQKRVVQTDLIARLCQESGLKIQAGGGIRSLADIERLFQCGVSRVVLGSMTVYQPDLVQECLQRFDPESLVLALDVQFNAQGVPMMATHGWATLSEMPLWDLLGRYPNAKHILCTDIARDGALQGVNLDLYRKCQRRYPDFKFQASGGVANLEDLKQLRAMEIAGVIIGKALYEKRFSLEEALKC